MGPSALMNLCLFCKIFMSLSRLLSTKRQRNETEKIVVFSLSRVIIGFGTVVGYTAFIVRVLVIADVIVVPWSHVWVIEDAIPQALFLLQLLALVGLWRPNKGSMFYADIDQDDVDEKEPVTVPG